MSDLDQTLTSAQAAMTFVVACDWDRFAAWCLMNFGRVPVSQQTMAQQSKEVGQMIDPERLPE